MTLHITPLSPALGAQFGDLHIHPLYPNVPEQPEILVLDTAVTDVRDNAIWHTDVSFLQTPPSARYSLPSTCRPMAETPCGPAAARPMTHCQSR